MALAAYAAAASVVMRRTTLRQVALAAMGWLAVATIIAFALLDDRERWLTRPVNYALQLIHLQVHLFILMVSYILAV